MKVFIMTDLEGVSGVNGGADTVGNKIKNIDASCRLLTEEVNSSVEGLAAAGAKEIVVVDGHGGSNSILIEHLHPAAQLITTASGGGLHMVGCGIDKSFDAAVQLGTHAMMGVTDGFLNHTFNSHAVVNMFLNGEAIGEIGVCSMMASYFSVPTILVSGDHAACREAKEFLGTIETVETKKSINRYSTINRNPETVRAELKAKSQAALKNLKKFKAKKLKGPFELKVELMCPNMADDAQKRGAERLNHNTVLYRSNDFIDLWAQRNGWAPGIHNKYFGI
ncbi:MAG: hypothetical protein A2017_10515 [Lentisphaerae bacterium GWF2_44_16]|nr:MAG: hypothetical protein A2017_10515 [Lentisphaerae bacterium GWF2_44_16]